MEHRFIIRQGGQRVASGTGKWPHIKSEGANYLAVYGQDGPVEIEWQIRPGIGHRWKREH